MSATSSQWIRTTTTETFRADVIDQSMSCPVVLDFWADWCGPCRQLMPLLEKLANEYDGRFVLVKVNVDENPEIAGAFGVQSIPFVVAMAEGQPVSQISGAQPEANLRAWLDEFLPSPAAEAFAAGSDAEAAGDIAAAEASFRKAVDLEPETRPFRIALARTLMALDRDQEASEMIGHLEAAGYLEADAESLKEQLLLRAEVEESGGTTAARKALLADPTNPALQITLAEALSIDKRYEESCELLLGVVQNNFGEVRDQAKEVMVGILTTMGPKSKLASEYRRKLATAFY
ncbi:MAG: thioredoxin [Planctomycetaceae bacterium]